MATDIDSPHKALYKPLFPENWIGSSWQQRCLLALLFFLSFIVPVIFGLKFLSTWLPTEQPTVEEVDPVFPENIAVQSQGAFLRVSDNVVLTPKLNEDFLLSAWFNLKRVPQPDEAMTLLSKVDHSLPLKPGYSLSLARYGSLVRPVVYWKDSQGKGGWYHFAEIRIVPRTWFSFVLTVQDADTIGLHLITIEEGKKPRRELLGGFKLAVPVTPLANSPLYIGSLQTGTFRGKIGPVSAYSGVDLRSSFKEIIKEISRDPLSVPKSVRADQVMLWCPDGRNDRSSFDHTIVRSKAAEKSAKRKSGA